MTAKLIAPLAGLSLGFGASLPACAQDMLEPEGGQSPAVALPVDEARATQKRVTVSLGAALVSQYISRGLSFAKEPSVQPYVTVSLALPELTGGVVTAARVFAGTWNNVKTGAVKSGETGRLARFYETDLYAGAAVELADRWTISTAYYRYESLSESFDAYNDLELIMSFDDDAMWDGIVPLNNFTLSPSLRMVQEAGRPGRADALYIQPSLSPSFDLGDPQWPVRVTIPLVLGFSDEYYDCDYVAAA